jgi:hypothetical protein
LLAMSLPTVVLPHPATPATIRIIAAELIGHEVSGRPALPRAQMPGWS